MITELHVYLPDLVILANTVFLVLYTGFITGDTLVYFPGSMHTLITVDWVWIAQYKCIQWNLSNSDTFGTEESVIITDFIVQTSMELGRKDVSLLEWCPHFRVS